MVKLKDEGLLLLYCKQIKLKLYRHWTYGLASRGGRRCVFVHPNALYKRPQLCGSGLHKPTVQEGKLIQYL